MTTNYARGAEFERRVKRHLETNGYTVLRSAGSKSPIDLIALKPGAIVLIQCKPTPRLSPADRESITRIATHVGATPVLASKDPRGHLVTHLITPSHTREPWAVDYA